jgi:hypothetical protein
VQKRLFDEYSSSDIPKIFLTLQTDYGEEADEATKNTRKLSRFRDVVVNHTKSHLGSRDAVCSAVHALHLDTPG